MKAPDGRSHLAAIIKGKLSSQYGASLISWPVPEAEHGQDYFSPWFVFNDFAVKNVSESEALTFPAKWKVRRWSSLGTSWLIFYRPHAF